MSATNTTTNYNLPIFIGSDKPAWLVDFNGAMNAIDAQMKVNADAIALKSPILTFNDTTDIDFTKTGDVITANLTSGISGTISRSLLKDTVAPASDQIVSVDSSNTQRMLTLGTGLMIDNYQLNAIDLNLSDTGSISTATLPAGISFSGGSVSKALNAAGTVGKIYGAFNLTSTTSAQRASFDTGVVVEAPLSEYYIDPVGMCFNLAASDYSSITLEIKTNGHVHINVKVFANTTTYCYIFPSIYFFKDFGDTPTP